MAQQTDHSSFLSSSSGLFEETSTLSFRFISRGHTDNILTHFVFHTTIGPDGKVKTEVENFTQECKG